MTGGEKDNMSPRLDLETFKCRLLLHMTCFVFLWVWLSILSCVQIFGEKISTLPKINIDVSATSVDRWLTGPTWYLCGCNN